MGTKGKSKGPGKSAKKDKVKLTPAEPATATTRAPRLTTIVPVRFEPSVLAAVRARAEADGRSVSAWIRRTVQLELDRARDSDASTQRG